MNKEQFLQTLRRSLSDLPGDELAKSLRFYEESIDDRVEDGMSEEAAVAALGDMDAIAREIRASLPLSTVVKQRFESEKQKSGGHRGLWIALLVLGFPVWLPLLLAAGIVVLAFYICVWALVITLLAVPVCLLAAGAAVLVYMLFRAAVLGAGGVLMLLGAAAALVGLALLLWIPLQALARGTVRLTAAFGRWVKRRIAGKGGK